ncbi:solute carrier family 22 member 18 isoform X1 [Columba livia]|uniref:Organic cation transporter-like protein 2 n=1 Tax=Columba livia TaxID=8932 RepID=A0A2I0MHW9_COLLI|nr:solute carrier family 22 member 18 isoform X1 [Columba livia]XP_021155432.1 solute carrier family 22 member 18 isoform X1 [Columba livia]KAK2519730.1 Slc22a18 [Columba livia]PKK29281.1 solute carrier family 22, member 18, transcript variant X1 [Columba livia]
MSTMDAKAISGGEEEASGMRSKTLDESGRLGEINRKQAIHIAYLIATLDLTFLFMQFGVMPYLAKSLGLDSVGFGYLQTTFGVFQLVGGPIFGRFADQFGARAALILSCASGSAFFLLMSISTSIPLLFLSRLPSVFMHGLPGAQKVITDLTTPSQRADALGKLGLCFGIGIIIGSALGGVLSTKFGIFVPAYVGLVGNLINTMIAMFWIPLPAKSKSDHRATEHGTSQSGSVFSIRQILHLMKFPGVMEVFIIKVFAGLPIGLFLIMFSIISMDFFGLEAVESGYLMSYFGVLQMVVQGLLVGKLTNYCTERTLLRLSVFIFAGVGLGMALMRTVWHYCIIAVPLVFAFSMLATITDSILTKSVPASDTGTMLGICASVQPLTRTVGPTIGGVLYKQFGVSSFGYLQLIVNIGLFVYLIKSKIPLTEMKSQ